MATQSEEENVKKLEKRKEDATELTKLKNKFKATKSKNVEFEQVKVPIETKMARLLSLYKKEKPKLDNVTKGIKVANLAIFEVGHPAMSKA